MNYLKSYRLFKEEAETEENPEVKLAKEKLEKLNKQISEYKVKKTQVDDVFLRAATDKDIESKIIQLLGTENKNPFLVDYMQVSRLKRKLDNLQKSITNDKLKKDDFQEEMKLAKDSSVKQAVNAKISDITNRISNKSSEMASLKTEIDTSTQALAKKMSEIEKNMMDSMKKISVKAGK